MADPETKSVGLYAKLAEAIAEVEHVAKDKENKHFKYRYASAEEIYRELRGPLLKRGLVFVPSVLDSQNGGSTLVARYRMRIIEAESGEVLEADWIGEGQDQGDKASYKAATGACKTWLRHLFMLPADDDPEADSSTDAKPVQTRNNASATTPASTKQIPAAKKALKASSLSAEAQRAIWVWGHTAPDEDGERTLSRPAADAILDAANGDEPDLELADLAKRAGFSDLPPPDDVPEAVPDETDPADASVPF